jgi:tetratricopeptide (TPR) repeat protein
MAEDEKITPAQEGEIERLLSTANIHLMRGRLDEAEDACRKALAVAPKHVPVREMLADILHEAGKLDAALEEYREAMKILPDEPTLETKYAKVVIEIGERERQKAIVKDMIEHPQKYTYRQRKPGLALLLSIVPGMGQLYNHDLVKAIAIWVTAAVFLASAALFQHYPEGMITSIDQFLKYTDPLVMLFGLIALFASIYGMIDAPFSAAKSGKVTKGPAEP